MPRGLIAPFAAAVFLTPLAACSVEDGASSEYRFAPTAISPDTTVTCDDHGDCGERGAVRWSTPLQGDYFMSYEGSRYPLPVPADQWMDVDPTYGADYLGAVEDSGTVYYYEQERFTAIDAQSGALLWTDSIDLENPMNVEATTAVGGNLIVLGRANRSKERVAYFAKTEVDGLDWRRLDVSDPLQIKPDSSIRDSSVLLEGRNGEQHLVDASDGEVIWSEKVAGNVTKRSLSDRYLYTYSPSEDGAPGRISRYALASGEKVDDYKHDIPLGGDVFATDTGELVLSRGVCEWNHCSSGTILGLDAETGEKLWERDGGAVIDLEEAGGRSVVHAVSGDGLQSWDARTGDTAPDVPGIRSTSLAQTYQGIPSADAEEREATSDDEWLTMPLVVEGLSLKEPLTVDVGSGTHYLTAFTTEGGGTVGVFQGCAPDGVRKAVATGPAGGERCLAPRVFTVDYGF
ncbi:outer membrane protein assembly factor BamB family protein [Nocardiopsis suaedae]|uniref:PQQ-binding-like beta-propeller repeat protein n=1 Tax=Nocardiopsis suaedae TaxID=3018444 RepID=A0ABT4TEY6_9ACTN|nr:PQQ-binding-like beta-propeller repeat protein [Nocardiopsis suaedae]MDA2803263.1 PQQ-binding-like beta-propeller repeat protein [Nocardiopsis suaedae]